MKKLALILVIFLIFTGQSFANGSNHHNNTGDTNIDNTDVNFNKNINVNHNNNQNTNLNNNMNTAVAGANAVNDVDNHVTNVNHVKTGDSTSNSASSAEINNSLNMEDRREFHTPGTVQYGPVTQYNGPNWQAHTVQSLESLILYNNWFTEGALEKIASGKSRFHNVNEFNPPANNSDEYKQRWIKVVLSITALPNVEFIGYASSYSDGNNIDMPNLLAALALEALHNGCNIIQIHTQGIVAGAHSSGWGVGLYTSSAHMENGQNESSVSGGGLGWSTTNAEGTNRPWLQGYGLIDRTLVPPTPKYRPPVKKKVPGRDYPAHWMQRSEY